VRKKMPEDVKMNTESGVIEVRSYGHGSLRHLSSSRERVELIMKQSGVSRVLVDVTDLKTLPDTPRTSTHLVPVCHVRRNLQP
jgi:hypothetical protein